MLQGREGATLSPISICFPGLIVFSCFVYGCKEIIYSFFSGTGIDDICIICYINNNNLYKKTRFEEKTLYTLFCTCFLHITIVC